MKSVFLPAAGKGMNKFTSGCSEKILRPISFFLFFSQFFLFYLLMFMIKKIFCPVTG